MVFYYINFWYAYTSKIKHEYLCKLAISFEDTDTQARSIINILTHTRGLPKKNQI